MGIMSENNLEQNRKHPRKESDVVVEFSNGENSFDGTIVNYSESGVAVEFRTLLGKRHESFAIGEDITFPTKNDTHLQANIVRNYGDGIGAAFSNTENVMDLLNQIVSDKDK